MDIFEFRFFTSLFHLNRTFWNAYFVAHLVFVLRALRPSLGVDDLQSTEKFQHFVLFVLCCLDLLHVRVIFLRFSPSRSFFATGFCFRGGLMWLWWMLQVSWVMTVLKQPKPLSTWWTDSSWVGKGWRFSWSGIRNKVNPTETRWDQGFLLSPRVETHIRVSVRGSHWTGLLIDPLVGRQHQSHCRWGKPLFPSLASLFAVLFSGGRWRPGDMYHLWRI